ncbi:MAG: hypothetical protein ACXWXY_09595 [Aeromicrobium sp.]
MPPTTALRHVSTFAVGALFAVVFVCSGASATRGHVTGGESAGGAHSAASKATARVVPHTDLSHKVQAPVPLDLAASGPTATDDSPVLVIDVVGENTTSQPSSTLFTTSERAPPAL